MLQPLLHRLFLSCCLCTLTGCAASSTPDAPSPAILAQAIRTAGTPLALQVALPGARGHGSGILVHPRIILTAGHIVPINATSVTAFTTPEGAPEIVRIDRIFPARAFSGIGDPASRPLRDWSMPGDKNDDWALLVLGAPFTSLDAAPAETFATAPPTPGDAVIIAGFPMADGGRDASRHSERIALFHKSDIIPGTKSSHPNDQLFFGRGMPHGQGHSGASGSPVFLCTDNAPPALIGIYIGEIGYHFLGARTRSEMMFRRLPLEAIRDAIDSLRQ